MPFCGACGHIWEQTDTPNQPASYPGRQRVCFRFEQRDGNGLRLGADASAGSVRPRQIMSSDHPHAWIAG
jgi:hypothetical protein